MEDETAEWQLERFRGYIRGRLDDADFRLTDVARAFRLSDRYVRRLFRAGKESPSTFLRHERLELAAGKLRDRRCQHLTLLAIALDCGFKDPAHFSRSFRRRFGVAPRAYRQGSTGEVLPRARASRRPRGPRPIEGESSPPG